jgi:hypothetical protein
MPQLGNPEVTRGEKVEKKNKIGNQSRKGEHQPRMESVRRKARKSRNHRNGKMMGKKNMENDTAAKQKSNKHVQFRQANIPRKVTPVSHDVSG